jgi:hypothetical protein
MGKLIAKIEKNGEFTPRQMDVLRKIVGLRNWVVHEIYEEEREYNKTHSIGFLLVDARDWITYYRTKLAATKSMMYEAVDCFNGAASLIRNMTK